MQDSKKSYKIVIFSAILIGVICISFLYLFSLHLIAKAFADYKGALQVVLIISARIVVLSIISYYLFNKWFNQEAQYLSDIPFLLGLFFIILIFGKAIDLIWDLTFFTFNDELVLIFLKFRFFIIIFEIAPLLYLGMEIIFFRLEDRYNKLKNKSYMNNLRFKLITIILPVESVIIFITPHVTLLGMFLPMMLIPSLLGIVYIFYLAYRLNRLSVVKPKILTIGFFIYLISNVFRPTMQRLLGENASYIIVVESVDLIIFVVIFLGLYKKS